jgi:hypothetical protein
MESLESRTRASNAGIHEKLAAGMKAAIRSI